MCRIWDAFPKLGVPFWGGPFIVVSWSPSGGPPVLRNYLLGLRAYEGSRTGFRLGLRD